MRETSRGVTDSDDGPTVFGFDLHGLNDLLRPVMAASVVGMTVSIIGMALLLLAVADEPFVDEPTIHAEPFSLAFVLAMTFFLSLGSLTVSTLAYSVWSFWEARQVRTKRGRRPLWSRLRNLHRILSADSDTLDEYERRVELGTGALIVGLFLLAALLDLLEML